MFRKFTNQFRGAWRVGRKTLTCLLLFLLTTGDSAGAFRQFLLVPSPARGNLGSEERNSGGEEETRGGHAQHNPLVRKRSTKGRRRPPPLEPTPSDQRSAACLTLAHRSLTPPLRTPPAVNALVSPLRC